MSFLETYVNISSQKRHPNSNAPQASAAANSGQLPIFFDSEMVLTNEVSILCFPPLLTRSHFLWHQNGATPLENLPLVGQTDGKKLGEHDRVVNIAYMDCMVDGIFLGGAGEVFGEGYPPMPIGSMGLIYFPTFKSYKSTKCRYNMYNVPYMYMDPLGCVYLRSNPPPSKYSSHHQDDMNHF